MSDEICPLCGDGVQKSNTPDLDTVKLFMKYWHQVCIGVLATKVRDVAKETQNFELLTAMSLVSNQPIFNIISLYETSAKFEAVYMTPYLGRGDYEVMCEQLREKMNHDIALVDAMRKMRGDL